MTDHRYSFRRVTADDADLLMRWQSNPHVRAWWEPRGPYSAEELADRRVLRQIVTCEGCPFAFMQDYTVHGWEDHHFAGLPEGSRGIDQYIGAPDMLGIGHGPRFIRARMQALFEAGAPVIATDPHPDNARAIRAYSTLGFTQLGPPRQTPWGLILPMVAKA